MINAETKSVSSSASFLTASSALREAVHIGADDLPFVKRSDASELQLLQVDLTNGLWVVRSRFKPGCRLPTHYHTGPVFAVTSKGEWSYLEYPEQINRPGSFLFEPAGSVHTLAVPEAQAGETEVWFAIFGANLDVDANGAVTRVVDAGTILKSYRESCRQAGLSAERVLVIGE
ncbi:2,4'-dihydroxyacetophenone dioxygenase family protein [Phenylobacterium sp. VNQ135]|uniref:2,4'-dihydroxyacetophenone dioxygenase family protein n=1 Tax=Phenylobacterium sp. VNQ135 TaxID=3400922 RepID=UPI003BFC4745